MTAEQFEAFKAGWRKWHRRRREIAGCDDRCPFCQIDRLKKRLGADYCSIEAFATNLGVDVPEAERFLREACISHDPDAVEAGREPVGERCTFIEREFARSITVQLYSLKPVFGFESRNTDAQGLTIQ